MVRAYGTTTEELLTVNGVILNTFAKNIESLAGRLRTPSFRTENRQVPGRHGALRTPNKMFDENSLALPMWVAGCDDNGHIPAGSNARKEFYKRVDELTRLFKGGSTALDIRHTLPDLSVRQCFGDVLEVFDFTTDASPLGLFSVNITVYDPFWRDVDPQTQTFASANGSSVEATQFAGSTAPMDDLTYQLIGPWTNPVLTFADGSWIAYDVALTAGQGVTIDAGTWKLTGTGGHTVNYGKVRHDGRDGRWASLPTSSQVITLGGSARTTSTQLIVAGRRKFLVG